VRQHDLSFANFILRFGPEEVLLDYAEEIVLPAFLAEGNVRKYGETEFRLFDVELAEVGREDDDPILALSGHFIKDTVLRRQQIFRRGQGLIEDVAEIESAPSAFFVLILNNHRLLYFAETVAAPTLDNFRSTIEYFLRQRWHAYVRAQLERENVTRRGAERLTLATMRRRIPTPVLAIVPVAGEDAIAEVVQRFGIIKQVRFKLVEPNDELDASETVAAVERTFRPLEPDRLEVIASQPKGLNKVETTRAIVEASEGHNTEIAIDGEDPEGLRMKADNEQFALSVPIEDPAAEDRGLREQLVAAYQRLVDEGKVRRLPSPARALQRIRRLVAGDDR